MNTRKILPAAVALLMLVSVLGVTFSSVSDAEAPEYTDNLLEVGDAIGIGGTISFEDLVRIFALDGGEDYEFDDERLLGILFGEEDLLPDPMPDLNEDGEANEDDAILYTQYIVFSLLSVLEEKLGLDLSASVSIYGMAEVTDKKGDDYVVRVDGAVQMNVSVGVSLGSRPVEGTYGEDDAELLLIHLLAELLPDAFEDSEDVSVGGFVPEIFEDESIWVNLNAVIAASVSGYLYMTKEAESPEFTINGVLLDIKAGADLSVSTNAKIGFTVSEDGLAVMISYPDEVQTIGVRASAAMSMELAFSATSDDSVLPKMGVYTEDEQTILSIHDSACLFYAHLDASVCAEFYGNGKDILAPVLGLLPPELSNGNGIVFNVSMTQFEDYTGEEAFGLEIGIGKNKLDLLVAGIEYDEESGKYTISIDGDEFGFIAADRNAPSLFSLLGTNSVVLDGKGKSDIKGAVNSIRNNMPGIQRSTSKVIFLNDEGIKFKTITVNNGEKISGFPEFKGEEDYVFLGWISATGDDWNLSAFISENTVITHDLILRPVIVPNAADANELLDYDWAYLKVEDDDCDFGPSDHMYWGERYMDFYKDGSLVSKWYFYGDYGDVWSVEGLKLNVERGDHSDYTEIFGDKKMMLLEFDASGETPFETQVSVPVDGDFGSGLFAVYEITDDGPVLRSYGRAFDGMATFSIYDFSDYLIVKLDVDPAAANVGTGAGGSSSNTLLYIGIGGAVAAAAVAGGALFLRRP